MHVWSPCFLFHHLQVTGLKGCPEVKCYGWPTQSSADRGLVLNPILLQQPFCLGQPFPMQNSGGPHWEPAPLPPTRHSGLSEPAFTHLLRIEFLASTMFLFSTLLDCILLTFKSKRERWILEKCWENPILCSQSLSAHFQYWSSYFKDP